MAQKEKQKAHYNHGKPDVKVGFIFSAPGRLEEKEERPVVGITGDNLDLLINILHLQYPEKFPFKNRYSYRITNAIKDVHYRAKTNNTEGSDNKVLNKENIFRILEEITGLTDIFCFGAKPKLLKNKLISEGFCGSIYCDIHLGLQAINRQIRKDLHGNALVAGDSDNNLKRIQVIANRLCEQIKNKR